ncbi:class I SAM-dependent methyltransferase [Jannaschia rubra]|uniref:class I SAM-dependent methyltransferase n=1 Tax=Jannaschia rubra TaxID=282197 RepID=UPI002490BF05|nr:methyltransferase [Jannaschia rubra]
MNSRLSLALSGGAVALPDGRVVLFRPPADLDLDGLPDGVVAMQGFRPDHDALAARGVDVMAEVGGPADAAVVFVARSKALTRDMIARACALVPAGNPVVVDGARADGIDSIVRDCRAVFDVGEVFAKAHGKCFSFPSGPAPDGWSAATQRVDGMETRAGVFSADGVDPGSAILARHITGLSGQVCDLGAGWGYLSRVVLTSDKISRCALLEAEHDALACARGNVTDPRAEFHWADATTWAGGPFDTVVTNPPFHTARKADPSIGRAFIAAAGRLLTPAGRLIMVANRHLPYEAALGETFAETVVVEDTGGYKVIEARRPRRTRGRSR